MFPTRCPIVVQRIFLVRVYVDLFLLCVVCAICFSFFFFVCFYFFIVLTPSIILEPVCFVTMG